MGNPDFGREFGIAFLDGDTIEGGTICSSPVTRHPSLSLEYV
jgi:hypothetical protein